MTLNARFWHKAAAHGGGNRIVTYNPYHRLFYVFSIFNVPTNVPTSILRLNPLNCDLLPSFLLVIYLQASHDKIKSELVGVYLVWNFPHPLSM